MSSQGDRRYRKHRNPEDEAYGGELEQFAHGPSIPAWQFGLFLLAVLVLAAIAGAYALGGVALGRAKATSSDVESNNSGLPFAFELIAQLQQCCTNNTERIAELEEAHNTCVESALFYERREETRVPNNAIDELSQVQSRNNKREIAVAYESTSVNWLASLAGVQVPSADEFNELLPGYDADMVYYSASYDETLVTFYADSEHSASDVQDALFAAYPGAISITLTDNTLLVEADSCNNDMSWVLDRLDGPLLDDCYTPHLTGAGVHVYVVDTGINSAHPLFATGQVSLDFSLADPLYNDCQGHGTGVAGIIGASVYGVARGVRIHSVRWTTTCDRLDTVGNLAIALAWVRDNAQRPAVVNLSLGFPGNDSIIAVLVRDIVQKNITVVTSAGNEYGDACERFPGNSPYTINVAGSDINDARISYSNYGTCVTLFGGTGNVPTLSHLGNGILTTFGGTSAAAPQAAAVAAMLLEQSPGRTPTQVKAAMLAIADVGLLSNIGPGSPNLRLRIPVLVGSAVPSASATPSPSPSAQPAPTCCGLKQGCMDMIRNEWMAGDETVLAIAHNELSVAFENIELTLNSIEQTLIDQQTLIVTDDIITDGLVVREHRLTPIERVSARYVFMSCSDMANTTLLTNRSLEYYSRYFNDVESVVPVTATPVRVVHLGDAAYCDIFSPDWLAAWFLANPSVVASELGPYDQVKGYWTFVSNTSENLQRRKQFEDNCDYKLGLYLNITAFTRLKARGVVRGVYDDHDSSPNNGGSNFNRKARSKQRFGNIFGSTGWVFNHNNAAQGAFSRDVITLSNSETVELLILDDQWYRTTHQVILAEGRAWNNASNTFLGDVQWAWLEETLRRSGATYRIIASGTPLFSFITGNDVITASHYAMEHYRMVALLERLNIERTIFVGGDIHLVQMYEDKRIANITIASVIASGAGQPGVQPHDPFHPEMRWGNPSTNQASFFVVVDVEAFDSEQAFVINFCQSGAASTNVAEQGVHVLGKYRVPLVNLERRIPAPINAPAMLTKLYAFEFKLTVIDGRPSPANQVTTPAFFSVDDLDDAISGCTLCDLRLLAIGSTTSAILSTLERDIRPWLEVGHTYNFTLRINNVNDTFTFGPLLPNEAITRYFLNIAALPISTVGLVPVITETFEQYAVGQVLVYENRTGAVPNWDGDHIRFFFDNGPPTHDVWEIDSNKNLRYSYTGGRTRLWFVPPVLRTLHRTNTTRIYFAFELYPITGNLGSGDGFYLYLPDTYDPVGNPLLTGPGVRGFEVKFQNTDVRVTPINNFSGVVSSRTFGYHPLIIGAPQLIEVELNFATNILSVQLDGVRYVFSASLVSPGTINGLGAIGLAANQLTSITDITVMSQPL